MRFSVFSFRFSEGKNQDVHCNLYSSLQSDLRKLKTENRKLPPCCLGQVASKYEALMNIIDGI